MTQHQTSPLLEPNSTALDDPTLGSPGLVAREIAIDSTIDSLSKLDNNQNNNYGSTDIEAQPAQAEEEEHEEITGTRLYIIIGSLYTGGFLAALDTTIVTTLLTTIASDIGALSKMSWIATSYLLSCSAFQPLYGKLSDIFGRKPLIIFSNIVFALGCLISGYSHTLLGLSIGRFISGIGGGGLTSLSTIATSDLVPLRKRGVYQGLGNISFGVGASAGGLFGSVLDKYFGWEYAFISQVPIALLGAVLIWKNLEFPKGSQGLGIKGSKIEKLKQVDFVGAILLVSSLFSFMILVSFSGHEIEINGVVFWTLIIFTIATMTTFVVVELYYAVQPVIPVRLLANRTVLSSSLVNWFASMTVYTYLYYVPVYWSSVLGLSPTQIGLRTISNFVGVSLGSFGSGIYMKRTGKYLKLSIISSLFSVFGVYIVYKSSRTTPNWFQYIELFIPGTAYAAMLTVTLLALIAAVSHEQQASTTSIQYAFRATGSTIGVAIASFIFQNSLLKNLNEILLSIPSDYTKAQVLEIIQKAFNSSEYTWNAPKVFREGIIQSYDISAHHALLFSLVTILISTFIGLFIQEHHLHTSINRK